MLQHRHFYSKKIYSIIGAVWPILCQYPVKPNQITQSIKSVSMSFSTTVASGLYYVPFCANSLYLPDRWVLLATVQLQVQMKGFLKYSERRILEVNDNNSKIVGISGNHDVYFKIRNGQIMGILLQSLIILTILNFGAHGDTRTKHLYF